MTTRFMATAGSALMRATWRWRPFVGAGILIGRREPSLGWQVLLFRRSIEPDRGAWSVVGGRQEPGETMEQTALREADEEAFHWHLGPRPGGSSLLKERLAGFLPAGFDINACRSSTIWFPAAFHYRTFLVELAQEPPAGVFTPDPRECDACRWFSDGQLPVDAHRFLPGTVQQLGLAWVA